jgi:hypothetical protein
VRQRLRQDARLRLRIDLGGFAHRAGLNGLRAVLAEWPPADNESALSFGHKSVLGRVDGLSRASFWRFSDLALAEARDVMGEIENLRVVDRSEHLSHD